LTNLNGDFSVFNYDSISNDSYVFDLQEASPYWILSPDSETISLYRFVDTSSRIDIIGYKHAFSNLPGLETPSVNLKILSSDKNSSFDSEWMQAAHVSQETTVLFLRDIKRYCKFLVEVDADSDLSEANFLLLVQIEISDILNPVISDHARSVLSRFPSWTKVYADSLQKATPEIAIPSTNAGRLINAIIGEDLDEIDVLISRIELDSFIGLSDQNQIAWLHVYNNIKPGFIKVTADYFEMARVSSMRELLEHKPTDFVFYYNFLTAQLFTLLKPIQLKVDDVMHKSETVQNINSFDEFGLKVGLQRLYLESNSNFKLRILDVYKNPPAINADSLKKTLRRELDIWRAFGSTPNSSYIGATPEILEISDIEKDDRYFSKDGIATKDFMDFVEYLNRQYPSNFGYVKWGEAYWDPAGKRMEGFSQIPQITDSATPEYYMENYQPGIGDLNDIKIKLEKLDYGIQNYSFGIRASGIKMDGVKEAYEPIDIVYDTYVSYYEEYIDNQTATITYDVSLHLNLHGDIPNDAVYKARYNVLAKNQYAPSINEYMSKDIFNSSGFTSGESIYYSSSGTPYINTFVANATESYTFSEIPLYAVDSITVNFISATNASGAVGNYGKIGFLDAVPNSYANQSSRTIVKTAAQIDDSPYKTKLKIISNIHDPKKKRIVNTPKIRSDRFGNRLNSSNDITKKSDLIILPANLIKDFILPHGTTPIYVHLENVVEGSYDVDLSASPYQGYGGISLNKQNNKKYLLSSQDNIRIHFINPNFATPDQHEYYIDTTGSSTVNYKFIDVKFPYSATPDLLFISATPSSNYPFNYLTWNNFTADYIDEISFFMSDDGVVRSSSTGNYDLPDNYHGSLIGFYDFRRSDFGLEEYASSPNAIICSLEPINENDDVYVRSEYEYPSIIEFLNSGLNFEDVGSTPYGILNYYDRSINEFIMKGIQFSAEQTNSQDKRLSPVIESGYIYQDGTPYYLYADKGTEIHYTKSEFLLESVARQGAPVILTVSSSPDYVSKEYAQVAFADEANPTIHSPYNVEYVKATYDNFLAIAYSNVFDLSLFDTYTGKLILTNQSYFSNIIQTENISGQPLIKSGTTYKVKYRVRDTFFVDNQFYNEIDGSYRTKIFLLSTPDNQYSTMVEYEKSIFDSDLSYYPVNLNPLYSALDEGYIYLSNNEYELGSVSAHISPKEILDNGDQFISVNIFSKDVNNNPKPFVHYQITGENLLATPSSVLTNEEGYARAYVKYIGGSVAKPISSHIHVFEILSATPTTSTTVDFWLKPTTLFVDKLSAEVSKKIINADGQELVSIFGSAAPNAKVYWRRGRNLFEAFNTPYSQSTVSPDQMGKSGMVTANQNGEFEIGPYRAQNDAIPGYWFVAVDTEMNTTPRDTPNTIAGDIVYWYEKYDVNQSESSEPVLAPDLGQNAYYYHYLTDSSFKKDFETEIVYYEDVFQNTWNLPKWYPISRYTQYQMGLLGVTPYVIETYENLHPDYEEE
jgi:hypothetical protein